LPSKAEPEGLSTRLLLALALTAGGGSAGVDAIVSSVRPQGDVAEALNNLASEVKELRRELVEVTKIAIVSTQAISDLNRRVENLETDRRQSRKN
jgi:septal ring factor EnvC (AmiA/AmiB activator)